MISPPASAPPSPRPGTSTQPPETPPTASIAGVRLRPASASRANQHLAPVQASVVRPPFPQFRTSKSHPRLTDLIADPEKEKRPGAKSVSSGRARHSSANHPSKSSDAISSVAFAPATVHSDGTLGTQSWQGVFVNEGKYVKASDWDLRVTHLSPKDARKLALPSRPVFHQFIKGTPGEPRPLHLPAPAGMDGTPYPPPAGLELVPVLLEDIVTGLPYRKTVNGLRIGGISPHVVVEADPGMIYVGSIMREPHATTSMRRLDPLVPDDKRSIDLFLEHRSQLKAMPFMLTSTETVRTVMAHVSGNLSPDMSRRDATFRVMASESAQMQYVQTCKSSLRSRQQFNAAEHSDDVVIYQAILGRDHVFPLGDNWNIGSAAGIGDLRRQLNGGNIAFATFTNEHGRMVYFSTSGSHRTVSVELHIHTAMGEADEVTLGGITFVDANRRIGHRRRNADVQTDDVRINLPALGVRTQSSINRLRDCEQTITNVVVHDTRDSPIFTSIHMNSLFDTCDSCASVLSILQERTGQSIDFVFHRDYGVTVANSSTRRFAYYSKSRRRPTTCEAFVWSAMLPQCAWFHVGYSPLSCYMS